MALSSPFASHTRSLASNQLSEHIPSTIGQLTALTVLYVVLLTIQRLSSPSCLLSQQGFVQQQVVRADSRNDWTIDVSLFVVRCVVNSVLSKAHLYCFARQASQQ
jgi:hypothetical protein